MSNSFGVPKIEQARLPSGGSELTPKAVSLRRQFFKELLRYTPAISDQRSDESDLSEPSTRSYREKKRKGKKRISTPRREKSKSARRKTSFRTSHTVQEQQDLWQLSHPAPRSNSRRRPSLSLESLPAEVLEVIFFYSFVKNVSNGCTLSLPRASLSLGRKLSSDYVRKKLFLRVCGDGLHRQRVTPERDETRSWIVRQPWFTYEFVRQSMTDWMVSILPTLMSVHKIYGCVSFTAPASAGAKVEPALRTYLKSIEDNDACLESPFINHAMHHWSKVYPTDPISDHNKVQFEISPSLGGIRISAHNADDSPPLSGIAAVYANTSKGKPPEHNILAYSAATQIPAHLLHGPWVMPKIQLLELLLTSGASIDWIGTTAGEIAEQGFREAIEENSSRALLALSHRPDSPSTGVGVIPTQEHLLLAIDRGCNPDVITILLNANISKCDLQDLAVLHRIRQMKAMDGREMPQRASWLELQRLDDQRRKTEEAQI